MSTHLSDFFLHLNTYRNVFPSKHVTFELGRSKDKDGIVIAILISVFVFFWHVAVRNKNLIFGHSYQTKFGSK